MQKTANIKDRLCIVKPETVLHWKRNFIKRFWTFNTIFNQRFYVFFIIAHGTREIVRFAITENPTRMFVRQQLMEFENRTKGIVFMIHDNAAQFIQDFAAFGIKAVKISIQAPDMNAMAERFVESVRKEALNYFLILKREQAQAIIGEYVAYYNQKRPHQGLNQESPVKFESESEGKIKKQAVLGGLHQYYYRMAA